MIEQNFSSGRIELHENMFERQLETFSLIVPPQI
jgi:hypothetical protein